jgi:hypothetical protein
MDEGYLMALDVRLSPHRQLLLYALHCDHPEIYKLFQNFQQEHLQFFPFLHPPTANLEQGYFEPSYLRI